MKISFLLASFDNESGCLNLSKTLPLGNDITIGGLMDHGAHRQERTDALFNHRLHKVYVSMMFKHCNHIDYLLLYIVNS